MKMREEVPARNSPCTDFSEAICCAFRRWSITYNASQPRFTRMKTFARGLADMFAELLLLWDLLHRTTTEAGEWQTLTEPKQLPHTTCTWSSGTARDPRIVHTYIYFIGFFFRFRAVLRGPVTTTTATMFDYFIGTPATSLIATQTKSNSRRSVSG